MSVMSRLRRIREIIEAVDNRCAAVDGPVTPTLQEMKQEEISAIYTLAGGMSIPRSGHHIDSEGRFQSDKYPKLPPDKVVISLKDPRSWPGLRMIGAAYGDEDVEFAGDLLARVHELCAISVAEGDEAEGERLLGFAL